MVKMYEDTPIKRIYGNKKSIDIDKGFYILTMEIIDRRKRVHEIRYIEDYHVEYIGWEARQIFEKKYRNNCGKFWIYKMHVVPVSHWPDDTFNVYRPRRDVNFYHMHTVYFPPEKDVSK